MALTSFIYDFIICLLGYLVVYQFLCAFFERNMQKKPFEIVYIFLAAFVLSYVNQFHNFYLNFVTYFISMCIMSYFLFFSPSLKSVGLSFFAVALAGSIELVTLPIVASLLKENLSIVSVNSEFQFAYSVFNQIVLFVILQAIIKLFSNKKSSNNKSAILLILPLSSIIAGLVFVYLDGQQQSQNLIANLLIAFACIGLLLTNIIVFYVYDKSLERYSWEAKYNLLENSNQAQLEYYRRLDEHLQDVKLERHDFESNLQIMLEMLNDHPDKVADYIKDVHNRISNKAALVEVNLNNPALSAILQEKHDACKKNNIKFDYTFKYNDLSFINISDTCAIFENALNNAVEACELIIDPSIEKFINLRVIRHNNMLVITLNNSRTNQLKKSVSGYVTSKTSPGRHGLGILSIQRAANRYDGEVAFKAGENRFTAIIQLNIL